MRPLLMAVLLAVGGNFPQPVGHVNDFAEVLSQEAESRLEEKLKRYADDTGIEVAVVTIASLDDSTVEEYTLNLANSWGVGDKKKDNGLVFLIAPNERKTRIEVGYGLEPDLPDVAAGRIIRDDVLPLFKEKKMEEGIIAGVSAIVAQLGSATFEQRLEERAKLEAKRAASAKYAFKIFLGAIIVAGLAGVISYLGFVSYKKRLEKQEIINRILNRWACFKEQKEKLFKILSDAEALLEKLKAEGRDGIEPKLKPLSWACHSIQEQYRLAVVEIGASSRNAKILLEKKSLSQLNDIHDHLLSASHLTQSYLDDIAQNEEQAQKWEEAKNKSSEMIIYFPKDLQIAKGALGHPDVSQKTRDLIALAEGKFKRAKDYADKEAGKVNWLKVFALISEASHLAQGVLKKAREDVYFAARAREKGPVLMGEICSLLKEAEEAVAGDGVSQAVKDKLKKAKQEFEELKEKTGVIPVNWLSIFGVLLALSTLFKKIEKEAKKDKEDRERARRKRSYSSSSGSGSWSSRPPLPSYFGSSPGGGEFGGFSGGSFGGGGASGSW